MNERDKSRLEDMLENARKVLQFAQGQTRVTLVMICLHML